MFAPRFSVSDVADPAHPGAVPDRSAEVALERANEKVTDRYGGTFIGRSVAALLAPPHGSVLRGAVVIIASDGWDSAATCSSMR